MGLSRFSWPSFFFYSLRVVDRDRASLLCNRASDLHFQFLPTQLWTSVDICGCTWIFSSGETSCQLNFRGLDLYYTYLMYVHARICILLHHVQE